MFNVSFGSAKREAAIRQLASKERTTALILAAVHFEWMLKRAILKLGTSPTKDLREQLDGVFRIQTHNGKDGYKEVWDREVGKRYNNAALGTVLGKLNRIQTHALEVRGRVIHGNGTVSNGDADEAIKLFLGAGENLRKFAAKYKIDLDEPLRARKNPKVVGA